MLRNSDPPSYAVLKMLRNSDAPIYAVLRMLPNLKKTISTPDYVFFIKRPNFTLPTEVVKVRLWMTFACYNMYFKNYAP